MCSTLTKNETPVLYAVYSKNETLVLVKCSTPTKSETPVLNAVHSQRMKCLFDMQYAHSAKILK